MLTPLHSLSTHARRRRLPRVPGCFYAYHRRPLRVSIRAQCQMIDYRSRTSDSRGDSLILPLLAPAAFVSQIRFELCLLCLLWIFWLGEFEQSVSAFLPPSFRSDRHCGALDLSAGAGAWTDRYANVCNFSFGFGFGFGESSIHIADDRQCILI